MIVTPAIPQSEAYHDFADQREFFGNSSSHFFCLGGFLFLFFSFSKETNQILGAKGCAFRFIDECPLKKRMKYW